MHNRPIVINVREYNKFIDIALDPHCNSFLRNYHLLSFGISESIQIYVYKLSIYPSVFQLYL